MPYRKLLKKLLILKKKKKQITKEEKLFIAFPINNGMANPDSDLSGFQTVLKEL